MAWYGATKIDGAVQCSAVAVPRRQPGPTLPTGGRVKEESEYRSMKIQPMDTQESGMEIS